MEQLKDLNINRKLNVMEYTQDYYEGESSNYSLFGGYDGFLLKLTRFFVHRKAWSIIRKYKTQGKLLDIGCAYGFWTKFSRKKGFSSMGCDISDFAISQARKRFPDLEFFQMDIQKKLGFPGNEFDVVTAFDVLEHCKNLDGALQEVKRVLKPDGFFLASIPDTDFFPPENDKDPTHVWHMNFPEWKKVFHRNNFRVEETHVFPWVFKKTRLYKLYWCIRFVLLRPK
ncbi:MAG: hypothetical protein DRP13_01925 [Candidatus Aenigmatarchaeota archaeon]|nr:MAG: hypothetical protein DRP13_01925 [Candidatus Aenigmarchaeota archaeon]